MPFRRICPLAQAEKYKVPDAAQLEYLTYLRAISFRWWTASISSLTLSCQAACRSQFDKLLAKKDSTYDVLLQNDDFLYIASNRSSVLVQGQVANPGHVPYVPGAEYEYYVRKAGDYQELADKGEVRIIKVGR